MNVAPANDQCAVQEDARCGLRQYVAVNSHDLISSEIILVGHINIAHALLNESTHHTSKVYIFNYIALTFIAHYLKVGDGLTVPIEFPTNMPSSVVPM